MALLPPFAYSITQDWGPTTRVSEPAGYGQLGRFWWNSFGSFRFYNHFHPGIDLSAAEGTPILASETGIVTAAGWNGVSGLRINVTIRPGTIYVHGHLSALAKGIVIGKTVKRGEVIAYVGHTGIGVTGPHSHFGLQAIIPNTHQPMIYDPKLFLPGGFNANDPRILPYYH